MLIKIDSETLTQVLADNIDCFVCCASFETRALVVTSAIRTNQLTSAVVLHNYPASAEAHRSVAELKGRLPAFTSFVETRIGQPLYTLDQLRAVVIPAIKDAKKKVLIDVTTFTHEHLLMFVYFLRVEGLLGKVVFAYTGARDYSLNTPLDQIWLTKGVKQVRSVVGYPGALVPSKDLHLIVMVGFEHERAQKVIETYEPVHLSLGFAPRLGSVTEDLSETNKAFFSRVQKFVTETREETTRIEEFEFSCVDPSLARDALLTQVSKFPGYNTVICPLNTKLATLGAALTAFVSDDIQLCYAEPAVYNEANYSSPGPNVTLFDLDASAVAFR